VPLRAVATQNAPLIFSLPDDSARDTSAGRDGKIESTTRDSNDTRDARARTRGRFQSRAAAFAIAPDRAPLRERPVPRSYALRVIPGIIVREALSWIFGILENVELDAMLKWKERGRSITRLSLSSLR